MTFSNEECKYKVSDRDSLTPKSKLSKLQISKNDAKLKDNNFGQLNSEEENWYISKNESDNFKVLKTDKEIYYHFKNTASLSICKLIGQIVGKAIFEDIPLEPKFTSFLLKWIISQNFEVKDLMTYDHSLSSSFSYIKNNVLDQNELDMNFTVQDKDEGIVELTEGGQHLKVNNYTKHAYISLFLDYYGYHKAHHQIEAFLAGVYEVVPK